MKASKTTHGAAAAKPTRGARADVQNAKATPLTPAQERFIQCWMVRRNATRAYQDAYPGATYATANANGPRLLRHARVCSSINALLEQERERLSTSAQKVSDHLASIAFTTVGDLYDKDGTLIPLTDLPRDVAIAVKKMSRRDVIRKDGQVIGQRVEVELHDRIAALRLLGMQVGMFTAKVEHAAEDTLLDALRDARERTLRDYPAGE